MINKFADAVEKTSAWIEDLKDLDKKMEKIGGITGPNLIDMIETFFEKTDKYLNTDYSLVDFFKDIATWAGKAADAVKKLKSWIDKLPNPLEYIPGVPRGDAYNPNFIPSLQGPSSISPKLYDELAGARRFGLTLSSGYRPGAVTRSGHPSDHSYFPSRAIDVVGPPARMAGFFRWLIGQRDVKQAFYDPLGSIFGGVLSSYREGGHRDHVHVATYDQAGWKMLARGWNMIGNFTGRPEPVYASGRGGSAGDVHFHFPNYVGSKSELMSWLQNATRQYRRQNGRSAF
jgi:hypothetical protein